MPPLPDLDAASLEELRRYYLFRPCETRDELRRWLIAYNGLDLPDCIVDEASNGTALDMVFETYSKMRANDDESFSRVLYYACRDGFKTLGVAAIEVLAILHLGRSVAHMAAIKEQASKAQSYVKKAFRRPHLKEFVVGDNKTETKIVRFYNPRTKHSLTSAEYEALAEEAKTEHVEIARTLTEYREREEYIKIVICTMQGANSEHVPLLVIDELDVIVSKAAYAEAQNIPSARAGKKALTIMTSTRKSAFGIVQDEIRAAERATADGEIKTHIRHWNLIDITKPCPSSRHACGVEHEPGHCPAPRKLPIFRSDDTLRAISEATYHQLPPKDKERYVKDTGYDGCLKNCKLFASCKTRLATHQHSKSTFLNEIPDVIAKFRGQRTIEMSKAQLLCRQPESTGLIYPRLDRGRHVITPAEAYFRLFGEWPADIPGGRPGRLMTKAELMPHVLARAVEWYAAMDFGLGHNYAYGQGFKDGRRFFLTHAFSSAGLETDQQVAETEVFRATYNPVVYPDMADTQSIRIFRKNGWQMRKWSKGPGSVAEGITAVRAKLNPVDSEQPELFLIVDVDEDPHMALLLQRLEEYHYKLDAAGNPTAQPQDDLDDECDMLRYLIMNVFPEKGRGVSVAASEATVMTVAGFDTPLDPNNWVGQKIAELTGRQAPPAPRRMTVEVPTTQGFQSYYGSDPAAPGPKAAPSPPKKASGATGRAGRVKWNLS